MGTSTVSRDEKRKLMERNIRVTLLLADGDPEISALLKKLLPLQHEYRDGHLFIGSEYPPKHEVRISKHGTLYCKCPDYAFRARKGDGLCKHALFAQVSDLAIPKFEDLNGK